MTFFSDDTARRLVQNLESVDETGQVEYRILMWEQGNVYYRYLLPQAQFDPASEPTLFERAKAVPREYYVADVVSGLTRAAVSATDSLVYFKKKIPWEYDHDDPPERPRLVAEVVLHEARVCEFLLAHAHQNICRYVGYIPSDDGTTIEGLCFEKHGLTLYDAVITKVAFDRSAVLEDIHCGLMHLHSLGYVHNDVNPSNVVLSEDGRGIIIDFDSCREIGESLIDKKAGTFSWEREPCDISEPENDFYGLEKIREWIEARTTPFRRFFVGNGHPMTADLRAEDAEIDVWKSIWKAEKLASIRENLHCSMGGVANNVADGGCDQLLENGQWNLDMRGRRIKRKLKNHTSDKCGLERKTSFFRRCNCGQCQVIDPLEKDGIECFV
ncbi:hypothetical protein BT96DRAFT_1021566 [Gymnopus androsaceus JB14]|uniref:Protein kinase domain-containing protein n=1 Tax=Gymnopus androsaceus JB14 TaxID=1447944 RepID=A0A6A4HFN1_9AGAR|nr:hypothetical protein BT96DRAFT_1021566 [Gymnopus androsaceus JB14]